MNTFLSIVLVILTYINTVITGIPVLVNCAKDPISNFDWVFKKAEIVTYSNYKDFYKQYADQPAKYHDKTKEYQALLDENLDLARTWRPRFVTGKFEFLNHVKNHAEWDYKRPARYPSFFDKKGHFSAYNVDMDGERLGNLNYGLTGAATGFSPITLYTGGGYLAIKGHKAKWSDYYYYFDDEYDHKWVSMGIMLYSLVDPNYTDDMAAIDVALSIADPRLACCVYKMFIDMQQTRADKVEAIETVKQLDEEVHELVMNDYKEILAVAG